MAYIAKQQSLRQWAQLVAEIQITSLNQIQNAEFTSLLLTKLDPQYFKPIIQMYKEGISLTQLFSEIGKYYSREIGTNIEHLMNDQINIYSTSSIEEIWQLVLGIAIKGRNRQRNINTILRMRPQTQEQLMRIISKLIARLGQNVSVIEGSTSNDPSQVTNNQGFNDTSIIMELTEQNEQLREKLQDLTIQMSSLNEKHTTLKAQLEIRNKQRRQIINVMIKDPISTKSTIYHERTGADSIVQFIKDIIGQVNYLNKQLAKKEEKQMFVEDVNKDLKLAYTTVFMQLEDMKKVSTDHHVDIQEVQKQIEDLRSQNIEYAQRQKDLMSKISELEQQKFYLKQIVQRLQLKNNISQDKVEKVINANKIISPKQNQLQTQHENDNIDHSNQELHFQSRVQQQSSLTQKQQNNRLKTVQNEIDELKQPSQRNKLQRQVSHLQKKLNSVQEQNISLKKINKILEKVINQFTKQSQDIMKEYQSEIQPIFQEFVRVVQEEQEKRKVLEEQANAKQQDNQNRVKELLGKIKQKMESYDSKQVQYQKMIKKLQIQRDQLLKSIKNWEEKPQVPIIVPVAVEKPKKPMSSMKIQVSIPANKIQIPQQQQPKQQQKQPQKISPSQITIMQPNQPEPEPDIPEKQDQKSNTEQQKDTVNNLNINTSSRLGIASNVAASIIMEQEEEQTNFRRRQYSFMGNRQSTYQMGQENQLGLVQKMYGLNKMSSIGSFIQEDVEKQNSGENVEPVESLGHVQIIDITQIEEELSKIKQHYVGIANRNQKICQTILNRSQQKQTKKQDSLPSIIEQFKPLAESSAPSNPTKQYTKLYAQQASIKAAMHTQILKLRHENSALKAHLINLSKQRQQIEQRLTYVYQQSSKSQTQRTKQELIKLSTSIADIKHVMAQSYNGYLQLQDYLTNLLGEGDKTVGVLAGQIQKLKIDIKGRDQLIKRLEEESMVLVGAMLEIRGGVGKLWS